MTERQTEPTGDDWLERALRQDAKAHLSGYLDDDGFTARVMAALPAPAAVPAWRRRAVGAMWTLAAVGTAVAFPDAFVEVLREAYRLAAQPVSFAQVGAGVVALGGAMWAGALLLMRQD